MPLIQPEAQTYIRLHKFVRAPKQRVFEALTEPDQFPHWFAPGPEVRCTEVVLEPQVGGDFRFRMNDPSGEWTGRGTITAFDPHDRLAYTWTWVNQPEFGGDSLVTFDLLDAPNPYDADQPGTEVVLTHERLGSAVERSEHTGGWWSTLRALGYYVRGIDPHEAMYGGSAQTSA
ncbi:MAG: SRPBCC domain-containing protein [Planctomycetota bacterium]